MSLYEYLYNVLTHFLPVIFGEAGAMSTTRAGNLLTRSAFISVSF